MNSGKRVFGGIAVPRKGASLVLRDKADSRDGNAQFCNRLGCSGRLKYTKGTTQLGCLEKSKSLRPCFRSSCGKEAIGSSSSRTVTNASKSFPKMLSSKIETDSSSESSSITVRDDDSEFPELIASARRIHIHTGVKSELRDAESSKVTLMEVGSSGAVSSNTIARKVYRQKSGLPNQHAQCYVTSASETTGRGPRDTTNANRYGLKNIRSNSISDILPQACLYSQSNNGRRKNMLKKKNDEGESSSSSVRGNKMTGPSISSDEGHISSVCGISILDTRRARNWPAGRERENAVPSVMMRRPLSVNTRMGRFNQLNGNNSSCTDYPILTPHVPQPEIHRFSAETSSSGSSSNGCPNSSDTLSSMAVTSTDIGIAHLMYRDDTRRYGMDGIAEVLLALERIEQDEELTYEQLISLETNLFVDGLDFFDQHRDMRLDIDNMSYEELLALEEEMGVVNTALSEEALSKCLRISVYQPLHSKKGGIGCSGDVDDFKCSICQEEYLTGDEIGWLGCLHGYHAVCINQWLLMKNWCPICKAWVVV